LSIVELELVMFTLVPEQKVPSPPAIMAGEEIITASTLTLGEVQPPFVDSA
jgi:hypothetical protein